MSLENIESTSVTSDYIEIVNPKLDTSNINSILFDFDGTISVLREGWQEIMAPLIVELLMDTPNHEDEETLMQIAIDYIAISTGIDTIFQMMHIAEEVKKRGGNPLEPLDYKREYLKRLWVHIEHRVANVKSGKVKPEDSIMVGSIDFLDACYKQGISMYVASGTDHKNVVDEAGALGVDKYFNGHIYGALDNYWETSKAKVIKDILSNNNLHGNSLAVFGDGYVEIENCKAVGGVAIGVASDEINRKGLNLKKRERLIQAGADIIIPDFTDVSSLMKLLFSNN